jgi:hypothetical protein
MNFPVLDVTSKQTGLKLLMIYKNVKIAFLKVQSTNIFAIAKELITSTRLKKKMLSKLS